MSFTPPIERGIFLTVRDDEKFGKHFVVGAAVRNPTDENVSLKTMDSKLFTVRMKQRTFTEEGREHIWSPGTGALQAVTNRSIKPNKTVAQEWSVPNALMAHDQAVEVCDDLDMMEPGDVRSWVENHPPVSPNRVGIVQVEVSFPAPGDYYDTLTRQFDLRTNKRALDSKIPEGDEDAMDSVP